MADPPPPKTDPPKDPQREQLQRELDLMTFQAQIATQQHTALLQSLPPSDVKPLDAKTTVDSTVVIEAEILAYRALHDVAKEIADKVTQGRTVLIHDDAGIAAWNAFRTFVAQLHELGKTYDAIAPVNETFALDFTAAGMSVVAVTAAAESKELQCPGPAALPPSRRRSSDRVGARRRPEESGSGGRPHKGRAARLARQAALTDARRNPPRLRRSFHPRGCRSIDCAGSARARCRLERPDVGGERGGSLPEGPAGCRNKRNET